MPVPVATLYAQIYDVAPPALQAWMAARDQELYALIGAQLHRRAGRPVLVDVDATGNPRVAGAAGIVTLDWDLLLRSATDFPAHVPLLREAVAYQDAHPQGFVPGSVEDFLEVYDLEDAPVQVSPRKIKGAWGIHAPERLEVDDLVEVVTRGGKAWFARVSKVHSHAGGETLAYTRDLQPAMETHLRRRFPRVKPAKAPAATRSPSTRQIGYAAKLLRGLTERDWYDIGPGDGSPMPTVADLHQMTSREISALIAALK